MAPREWKISRAGNSGVKYNVSEELSMAAAPNHAELGFEYHPKNGHIIGDADAARLWSREYDPRWKPIV